MLVKKTKEQREYLLKLKENVKNFLIDFKKRYDLFPWRLINKVPISSNNEVVTINGTKFTIRILVDEINKTHKRLQGKMKPSSFNYILSAYIKDAKNMEGEKLKEIYKNYKLELEKEYQNMKNDLSFCINGLKELNKYIKIQNKSGNDNETITESTLDIKGIDTLIFDFGGVLVKNNSNDELYKTDIPKEYFDTMKKKYFNTFNIRESTSINDVKRLYQLSLPEEMREYSDQAFDILATTNTACDYTYSLLKDLKEKGYKLYYLSNWGRASFELTKKKGVFDFIKYFDGGIISYQVGLKKPQKEIYELLLDKYNIDPNKALFFDDTSENVNAAKKLGIHGIKFNSLYRDEKQQGYSNGITVKDIFAIENIIQESSEDSLEEVEKFNSELNKWKYGVLVNGKMYTKANDIDWSKYKTIPIKDIEKYHVGVCWDFVNYQHDWFKKHNIKDNSYFFVMQKSDNPNDIVTHTFSIISINSTKYWFESSWSGHKGVHKVSGYKDVVNELIKKYDIKKEHPYSVFQYNPDGMDKNVDNGKFFDKATQSCIYNYEISGNITESFLHSSDDIYYNKDKFDSGEINLCFIIGHCGSGKSTMADKIKKENKNVEVYRLDHLAYPKDHFTMNDLKESGDLFYSFFSGPGKKYYKTYKELVDNKIPASEYEDILYPDFVHYAMKYASSHENKKYIIEGIWIIMKDENGKYIFAPEEFKEYAFYIKGTAALISKISAAKRDAEFDNESKKDKSKAFINNFIRKNWKNYIIDEKDINRFRIYFQKLINESYVTEEASKVDKNFKPKKLDVPLEYLDIEKNKNIIDKYLNESEYKKWIKYVHEYYKGEIVIDKEKDKLVGHIFIGNHKKDEGFISGLDVNKKYRGYGIGKKLLDDAVKKYGGVDLTVDKDNEIALKLYKNYGFAILGYGNKKDNSDYYMKLKSKITKKEREYMYGMNQNVVLEIANRDFDDRENILLKTIKLLKEKGIKPNIDEHSKEKWLYCDFDSNDFGESLCICNLGTDGLDKLCDEINKEIYPYGGILKADNYGCGMLRACESAIDYDVNKQCFIDFKDYVNKNKNEYLFSDIVPLDHPMVHNSKKGKKLLFAKYIGKLSKENCNIFLPKLNENISYNGEKVEFHTCYLPGSIFIFINIPDIVKEREDETMNIYEIITENGDLIDVRDIFMKHSIEMDDDEDLVSEGANSDIFKEKEKLLKEYKTIMKSCKKNIKQKNFSEAKKEIMKLNKILDETEKTIQEVDSNSGGAFAIGLILHSLEQFIKLFSINGIAVTMATVPALSLPSTLISQIGSITISLDDLCKQVSQILKNVNETVKGKKDITLDSINPFKNDTLSILSKLRENIKKMENNLDKLIDAQKNAENEKESNKKAKAIKESFESEKAGLYEACQQGLITIEEREELISEAKHDYDLSLDMTAVESSEVHDDSSYSKKEKFDTVKGMIYERCANGFITIEEREEMIQKAYNSIFESDQNDQADSAQQSKKDLQKAQNEQNKLEKQAQQNEKDMQKAITDNMPSN